MARREREYRRLPGRGRKRGSFFAITATRAALWAGKDHLLSVYTTGYTEEYKRFYYRDIQAIITRKTWRGAVVNIFLALFLSLFALLAITRTTPEAAVALWVPAGFSLLILARNVLLGPTCVCHVQTAVSREELPSLSRERYARKAIAILKPLIESAQGTLTPDEIVSRSAELAGQAGPVSRPPAGTAPVGTAGGYNGIVHEALFYLLLLDGLMSAVQIFVRGLPFFIFGTLVSIVFSIVVIVALTRQHGNGLNSGLRGVTWASFGYMVAGWLASYISGIYEMVRNPAAAQKGQWELFKMMGHASPTDNPVLMFVLVLSAVCAIPLGISGLVLLKKFQAQRKTAYGVLPLAADGATPTRTVQ